MTGRARPALRLGAPGLWLLAALAYLPAITAAPGRMPTDTKLYLYLDPGRLIADAPFTWDNRQFAGWVPHQTIAYLWPSGPWFWLCEQVGLPDWIAHRLWIGTLLFAGGAGVRWAARHLGLGGAAATVAGLVYATSPYILPYISRTSVMLLPWAGLGWLVGLTVRAARGRTRWRDAGLFGLVVLTIGAVNAAALALVAPAPVLWLVHAAWARSITWRTAALTAVKLGLLSLVVSMWWIVMLVVQGRHGADVLRFSETLEAVSLTSVSTETLRGLGYWLFYVRDPYAFTTTASLDYMTSPTLILIGFVLLVACLTGLALVRWTSRRFAGMLVFSGVVLAVGVHPIAAPSPLMAPLADSALGLALRSSTRALPLSTMGLALGAGALVAAAGGINARWRPVAASLVALLAVVNLPALWTGGFVDPALERDQDVPSAWTDAVDTLDSGSLEHRVVQLPGSEFGAFRWGYTVDPPLPGLTDKPLATRDLLPLGSPGAMDLLYALDNRFQTGAIDPAAIAPVLRLLGADTVWVANDLAFDRFRTPRPEVVADLFARGAPGLTTAESFGVPVPNVADVPVVDEQVLGDPRVGAALPPVQLVGVEDPVPIVRVGSRVVLVAGSGDGLVDAAAAGLLHGDEVILYAADLASRSTAVPPAAIPSSAPLVVTDSNRDRATHWRSSQDVTGMTGSGGPGDDVTRPTSADQRLQVFAVDDAAQQTVARLDGGLEVRASEYGEPFAYRPEDRASMAVDGDPTTAWRVSDRFDPVGQSIELSTTDGSLVLLQQQRPEANRLISEVEIGTASGSRRIVLGPESTLPPGQAVEIEAGVAVTVRITAVADRPTGTDSGSSAVGFAELGPVAGEVVRLPTEPLARWSSGRPLAIVLTRDRVRPSNRWRADPEHALVREFELPSGRSFDATVTLRLDRRAPDDVVQAVGGLDGTVVANRRLTGVVAAAGTAAFDDDVDTAWTTPFGDVNGAALQMPVDGPVTGPLTLVQPLDDLHSRITQVTVRLGSDERILEVPAPDAEGRSVLDLGAPLTPIEAAATLELEISGIAAATTIDRRYAETVTLPAALAELDGVPVVAPRRIAVPECHDGLLRIDGRPVGVTVGAEVAERLLAGEAVDVPLCDPSVPSPTGGATDTPRGAPPLRLEPGAHRITATPGLRTGIDLDRIVLRSTDPAITVAGQAAEPVEARVERTRTSRTATIGPCPLGCWLVLGEGYNPAWTARTSAGTLVGAPVQVSGGFNGWWLEPSDAPLTVVMTWTPQRSLVIALLIASLGVLACLAVVAVDRRTDPTWQQVDEPQFSLAGQHVDLHHALVGAVVLVVVSALVITPAWGLVAVVPAAVYVAVRRPALLVLAGAGAAGMLGLLVIVRQLRFRYPANAAWPGAFEDVHRVGLFVVVLVLAGSLLGERPATAADHPDGATAEPDPAPAHDSASEITSGAR